MPQPPILPPIDWAAVHAAGLDFDAWLAAAQKAERRAAMLEILQTLVLEPHEEAMLYALARPVHVIAIAEDWCGDVVRHVPALERIARSAPSLRVRYIARAQFPDLFARFLTNGGEAIPKFIFLNGAFVECGNWGPMPEACRRLISRGKACGNVAAARERVAALYAADPAQRDVIRELLDLAAIAACTAP